MRKSIYLSGLLLSCFLFVASASRAAVPVISANPGNDTVCAGTVAHFILAASDTATPASTVTFSWLMSSDGGHTWSAVVSGGAFSAHGDSLDVTTSVALNGHWFKGIATDVAGSDTSTAALLLVDSSARGIIAGPTAVCVGSQVTVSDSGSRGTWSAFNDSATINMYTGVVTGMLANGSSAGTDTFVYTISNTCITVRVMDTLFGFQINPLPAIAPVSGSATLCKGSTTTLTDAVTGGAWTSHHAGVDTVSSASGVVHGVNFGFDTVVYTTTTGLCNASVTYPIRVDTFVTALPITGPTTTCVGHTIDLMNVNVLGTWTWSAGNTHASISHSGVVTGLSGGIDIFTYSFTNACNTVVSTSAPVAIDTLLSAGTISGPSAVCQGSWIHLSESVSGGIWLSSNSSIAVVDGSGNVTGVAIGAPTISYIVSNGCGDVVATKGLTVDLPASLIAGIDSVGIDSTITLSDTAIGGVWTISNDSIATIGATTGIVTGVAAGSAVVTYSVTNDCGTTMATMTIYVGPPPYLSVIGGADSVCLGNTITLTDSVAGGTWTTNSDSIASVSASGVVTGNAFGAANITYTFHNAFGTSMQVQSVFVNEPPVVIVGGPSVISMGGDYFLFGHPYGGSWSASNSVVGSFVVNAGYIADTAIDSIHHISVTYGSFVVIHAGSDTLTYTVSNTCGTRSQKFIITLAADTSSFVPMVANNALLSVYPNPASGEFTLNLASGSSQDAAVTITNMVGEKVRELTISTNKNYNIKLNEPNGVYLISAVTADGVKYYSRIAIAN